MAPLALTAIVRRPLLGRSGERVGLVRDAVALLPECGYPSVPGLVARIGERDVFVPMRDLEAVESTGVRLSLDRVDLRSFERRPRRSCWRVMFSATTSSACRRPGSSAFRTLRLPRPTVKSR
jgi:hypothetical protein